MSFERTFQFSSYLALLAGFAAILTAGGIGPVGGIVYLFLLAATWLAGPRKLSRPWQVLFVIGAFVAFGLDYLILRQFGAATIRLLLLLSLYKALLREKPLDYLINYLISFSLLLIASTYTISISYPFTLVAYYFCSVFTFILFENRSAYLENRDAEFSLGAYVKAALIITVLTMVLAVPIFLAVPRGSFGLFGATDSNVSGFSSSVTLGEIGTILRNPDVVMRVSVDAEVEALPATLRWRGIALDYFDGRVWSNTRRMGDRLEADGEGRYLVSRNRRQNERLLEQTFYLEPFSDVVFGTTDVVQLFGLRQRRRSIWKDGNEGFFVLPRPRTAQRYFVHSDIKTRAEQLRMITEGRVEGVRMGTYLQLPELDSRIPGLVEQLTADIPTPVGKALRLESYLQHEFTYTLDNPVGGTADPLSTFLFDVRSGHCEYFATAQAVMLRVLGIPSRVVNGFLRGEYNEWGDYFIVKQSDAHSWVEAYFPGAGWIEFDPTPPVYSSPRHSLLVRLGRAFDALNILWVEVVTFDRFKQAGFFQSLRTRLEDSWDRASQTADSLLQVRLPRLAGFVEWLRLRRNELFLLVAALLSLFLIYRYRRYLKIFWKRRILRETGKEIAQEYYRELLEVLARRGYPKSRYETAFEFGYRVGDSLDTEIPLQIIQTYYRNRFGGHEVAEQELAFVYSSLRKLKR
ncbi:MAG: DUF3488 domain-containing protein [Acidobacteriota bacterium]|nr:MAG: DUF3488 domain-containing protein [Acidobacteriota bacterium]